MHKSRTSRRCVDWNTIRPILPVLVTSRTSRRCVDWNNFKSSKSSRCISRTSRRCVDWNSVGSWTHLVSPSRTSRRCVDWNLKRYLENADISASHLTQVRGLRFKWWYRFWNTKLSHLTQVRGLKFQHSSVLQISPQVAPHAGAWIEIQ